MRSINKFSKENRNDGEKNEIGLLGLVWFGWYPWDIYTGAENHCTIISNSDCERRTICFNKSFVRVFLPRHFDELILSWFQYFFCAPNITRATKISAGCWFVYRRFYQIISIIYQKILIFLESIFQALSLILASVNMSLTFLFDISYIFDTRMTDTWHVHKFRCFV